MTTKEALEIVEKFKDLILDYTTGEGDKSVINQNIAIIKKITNMTKTYKTMTIASPSLVGGYVLKNVDPLDSLFNVPYEMEIDTYKFVIDMMYETMGVLKANPLIIEEFEEDVKDSMTTKKDFISYDKTKIFIVHGRDNELKESVARFIENLGLKAIILHEQANGGKTIIEKFEDAADVGFAIVLLTPDDEGGLLGEQMHKRARQNVIFELGYFIGRLKRGHVAALVKDDIEIPSDITGVAYIKIDSQGFWKITVAKELKACGFDVDLNKLV